MTLPRPVTVLVVAKRPAPGRTKTRLCPPLTPQQAAEVAAAALADTLDVVRRTPVAHRVVVLDGDPWPALDDLTVLPQRGGSFDDRLAYAFADAAAVVGGPLLLIGMDTPQLTAQGLGAACDALLAPDVDAVLGPAEDGGWWGLGLHRADPTLLRGIPTSTPTTGADQRARLLERGLRVADLPVLRDVDTAADLAVVAAQAPGTRFAAAVAALDDLRVTA